MTHEILFALNFAWTMVWVERLRSKELGGRFAANQLATLFQGVWPHVATIGGFTILEQIIWSLLLATVVFLILRMLSPFAFSNAVLRTIAGVVPIVGFPLTGIFFSFGFSSISSRIESYHFGLFLEVISVLTCGILFYLRKPWLSVAMMTLVLFFHFGIWTWLTSSYVNVPEFVGTFRASAYYHSWALTLSLLFLSLVFKFGFPTLGLLASLTWMRYIRYSSET